MIQMTNPKKARPSNPAKRTAPKTVDDYLARVPQPARGTLEKLRATIRSVVPPEATEVISYGIPAFAIGGKKLVWFAAHKRHIGFYPGAGAITAFKKELSTYKSAKGSVQFPFDEALPLALVGRIVKFRLGQGARRA